MFWNNLAKSIQDKQMLTIKYMTEVQLVLESGYQIQLLALIFISVI